MYEPSRRTMLGQLGLTVAAVVSVGRVRAADDDDVYDALEEIRESLVDFREEVEEAEVTVDDLASDLGGFDRISSELDETTDLDSGSDFDGLDDGPDFDGLDDGPDFDGLDDGHDFDGLDGGSSLGSDGPEFDGGNDFDGGDGVEATALEDLDDDLVINGVPVGEAESLDDLNESALGDFEGTVVINGVEVGGSADSTVRRIERGSDSSAASARARGSPVEDEPQTSLERRLTLVMDELDDVSEEHEVVSEALDEIETFDRNVVEQESRTTEQLLEALEPMIERVRRHVSSGEGAPVETMERIKTRLETRIDTLEATMDEFAGDEFL